MELLTMRNLFTFAFLFAIANVVSAAQLDKATLIGQWDYTSYTILQRGRPSGAVQFKPRTMLFTYHEGGAWEMEAGDATHTKLNGSYEVHDTELIMKKTDGSTYQDFTVEFRNDGKEMVMRDKRSIVTASKVEATP
ncbi:hypothetical protein [Tunturiibacter gelidoferens]|uniref:Uncharacterized protein n=1 Tax=Tunturiibacter gelidiferens TaxID=3069689 RepID=A0ACC5NUS2_9BACT|nr:hypothetical protein [Edaphobacter lichenicola]MBB5338322.1 hypothetical protein [Edaphobacter lichenicola]